MGNAEEEEEEEEEVDEEEEEEEDEDEEEDEEEEEEEEELKSDPQEKRELNPGAWHYRVSAGTGRPGVSVAARKIVQIRP